MSDLRYRRGGDCLFIKVMGGMILDVLTALTSLMQSAPSCRKEGQVDPKPSISMNSPLCLTWALNQLHWKKYLMGIYEFWDLFPGWLPGTVLEAQALE